MEYWLRRLPMEEFLLGEEVKRGEGINQTDVNGMG
jgi:hypothetical protein